MLPECIYNITVLICCCVFRQYTAIYISTVILYILCDITLPGCVYNIIVLICCCVLTEYNTLYKPYKLHIICV